MSSVHTLHAIHTSCDFFFFDVARESKLKKGEA